MKKNFLQKNKRGQKGFVLLFAVLVSSLVLAVGISIISISVKQVILSGTGRDSKFAFYVANTGIECARYWDYVGSVDPIFYQENKDATSSPNVKCLDMVITKPNVNTVSNPADCPGADSDNRIWCQWGSSNSISSIYNTKFRISYYKEGSEDSRPYCADVTVTKEYFSNTASPTATYIIARGYNTCDETNPRRIERALEFRY